jgi:hypothetical protein
MRAAHAARDDQGVQAAPRRERAGKQARQTRADDDDIVTAACVRRG